MTKREKWLLLIGGVIFVALASSRFVLQQTAQAERRRSTVRQFKPTEFEPQQVVKAFPAIVNPPNVTADEVNGRLQPTELVLGVELDGLSRAYPINMLTGPTREIFNDTLGEHSLAATW